MFGFFRKTRMDITAAQVFWKWFAENEEWIIDNIPKDPQNVILTINEFITPVFPYYYYQLDFEVGVDRELSVFDCGYIELRRDIKRFKKMMPADLKQRWTFLTGK